MLPILTEPEVRIIGALIEKQHTTPDYYPMSLNSLVNACNQKSNRNPVTNYSEQEIEDNLALLREKGLAAIVQRDGNKVSKYMHLLDECLSLELTEVAVLYTMLIRGPLTLGEIRGKCKRIFDFSSINDTEDTVNSLMEREEPLLIKLARQPGRKEYRYTHLLSGEPESAQEQAISTFGKVSEELDREEQRINELETQLKETQEELAQLREEFYHFKKQFE